MPGHPGPAFRRWPFWKRWLGRRSERAAASFLRSRGLRVLAQNVADKFGELDLIAFEATSRTLVIVEVRSTSHADPRRAADTVDATKQRRLTDAAMRYLSARKLLGTNVRFDVVAIAWPPEQATPTIEHYPDAFEARGRWQMFG